jgi:predicted transcriptional regulator
MSTMGKTKLSDKKLLGLVDEGLSLAEIAREHGISRQAVSKRLIELRGKTTKAVVAKKVSEIVERKIDALEQLNKINTYANELLDLLMRWNRGDEEAIQILESQVRKVKVGSGDDVEWIKEYKFKDPRELALRAMAEIRGQLSLQLEIFQALFSLQAAEEFQNTVLEVIREVDPHVRDKIIRRLNERRTIRQAVHFH